MSSRGDFVSLLRTKLHGLMTVPDPLVESLYNHYELLMRWNQTLNLTRVTSLEDAVERHYCESLCLGLALPAASVTLLDVGSGGGFPGVPIALMRQDCEVTLAESHRRKAVFLREATRTLANVQVFSGRAGEVQDCRDWVVSRAVRWPDILALVPKSVGLLLSSADAAEAVRQPGYEWRRERLPWGRQRCLVIGHQRFHVKHPEPFHDKPSPC